jgi:hypothetical protein
MVATVACAQEGAVIRRRNVRFGSKADMCGAAAYVRPDMCSAARDVRKQKDRLHNGPSETRSDVLTPERQASCASR